MILSRNALAVMLGGGAGAVCRVMMGLAVMEKLPSGFPLGVLCANVLGGFLMGLLQGWMRRTGNTFATGYCLLGTGFLGGLYHVFDLLARHVSALSLRRCILGRAEHSP